MMTAFKPGLARKASQICLCSTITISAHKIKKTSIRTRKMRGDESFRISTSCAIAFQINADVWPSLWHRHGERKQRGCRYRPKTRKCGGINRGELIEAAQGLEQVAVNCLIAGDDAAARQHGVLALQIGDIAAGLAHQQNSRCHIPRGKVAFPVTVEAP